MFTALGFSTTQSYQLILFWRIPFLRIYGWSIVDVDRNDNVVDSSFTLALQSLMFQILDAFCVLVSPVFYDHYLIWIACLFIEGLLLIPILLMYILGLFLLQVMINTLDRSMLTWWFVTTSFVGSLVRIGSASGQASFHLLGQFMLSCAMWIPRAILLVMSQYHLFPRGKLIFTS